MRPPSPQVLFKFCDIFFPSALSFLPGVQFTCQVFLSTLPKRHLPLLSPYWTILSCQRQAFKNVLDRLPVFVLPSQTPLSYPSPHTQSIYPVSRVKPKHTVFIPRSRALFCFEPIRQKLPHLFLFHIFPLLHKLESPN